MKKTLTILSMILLVTAISACSEMHLEWGGVKPATLSFEGPDGPPEYRQGFSDGCQSGFSGYANNFNKLFHTWKQDAHLAQDPVYYQIWKDAYAYCANYGMMADEHTWGNWR